MSNEMRTENKMGVMPVRRLILTMSTPMMFSMLVQALYNIVDSIFVSRIDEAALTAVTLAFPMQNFMIAVTGGTGVGINALLSRSLGEKNYERADQAACTGIILNLIHYLIFLFIGLFLAGTFIRTQSSDPLIIGYGETYLRIVCILSIGVFFQITMERLLQSTGRTFYSMLIQVTGVLINLVMDPALIFGLGPFPALGVAGAAYATIFGQIAASCLGVWLNVNKNDDIRLSVAKILHPDINPETSKDPDLLDLWNRVSVAYKCNNLEEIEELQVLVNKALGEKGIDVSKIVVPDIEEKIKKLEEKINEIITTDPYNYKFILEDKEETEQMIQDFENEKKEYDNYRQELENILSELTGD